jgi:putative salt-induced outer membrane protein YdiY
MRIPIAMLALGLAASSLVQAQEEKNYDASIALGYVATSGNTDTTTFNTDIGDELTVSRFEVGLESNIIDRLATKIAFQARNTSKVPVGNKKTDTLTSVSLVYSF